MMPMVICASANTPSGGHQGMIIPSSIGHGIIQILAQCPGA